jgi:hypothetical protein
VRDLREHGLRVELAAYGSRVLIDWKEVARDGRPWDELAGALPPEGTPDLERALWAIAVRPAHRILETVLMGRQGDPFVAPEPWLDAFDALVLEAERRLSWRASETAAARARFAARLGRWHALEGTARGAGAERAASEAWLLLEACGNAFAAGAEAPVRGAREPRAAVAAAAGDGSATGPAAALRLFDELLLRDAVARAARGHGVEGEDAWRLAARVRAMLAHPDAGANAQAWRALLADEDARYAAGLGEDATAAEAPRWLRLPSNVTEPSTPGA